MNHPLLSPVSRVRHARLAQASPTGVISLPIFRAAGFSLRGLTPFKSAPDQAATQRRIWSMLIAASFTFACAALPAQSQGLQDKDLALSSAPTVPEKPVESEKPLDGIWPTPKLMKSVLKRWARQVGDRYELDADQQAHVDRAVVDRWTGFLTEHRKTIQPIFNEFLELRMEVEPPAKDSVVAWAQQSEQAFDMVRKELALATQDVREVLTARQRIKFEVDMLAFGSALELAKQRLERFKQGDFEPQEFWTPTATQRRKRREKRSRQREINADRSASAIGKSVETQQPPTDQIMLELNRWQAYVTEFISLYELDEGQRNAAISYLRELSQRALDHRNRYHDDIEKLEQRIAENTSEGLALEQINKDLTKLYGPIDDMFAELQARLNNIPTANQRAKAAKTLANRLKQSRDQAENVTPSNPPPPLPKGD